MISKVIAWGRDRTAALDTLDAALAGYTALGIDTNVEYLRLLINDADVRAGRLDTGLIERKMPDFSFRRAGDAELVAAAMPFCGPGARSRQRVGIAVGQARGTPRRLAAGCAAPRTDQLRRRRTAESPPWRVTWLSNAGPGRPGARRRRPATHRVTGFPRATTTRS